MSKVDAKDDEIRFRAAGWEVDLVERAASAAGLTKSEFCRRAIRLDARRILSNPDEESEG